MVAILTARRGKPHNGFQTRYPVFFESGVAQLTSRQLAIFAALKARAHVFMKTEQLFYMVHPERYPTERALQAFRVGLCNLRKVLLPFGWTISSGQVKKPAVRLVRVAGEAQGSSGPC